MASTFSPNLSIELIGTGDQAGTWGTTTNSNLGTLIEQAISGYVTQAVATGTDTTITIPNGSTGVARNMYIELTGTGGASTNLIVPSNKKLYFIFNNSTGAVTVKVSGQTGVSVPTGKKMVLVSNGTDIVNGLNYIADFGTNSFSVTNLTASSATITNLIATSGSITNLVSSDASATVLRAGSATLTHLSATSASITNLTLTSLVISNLSIASANITTLTGSTQTLSGNLTLSGGTANGVLYLNGSKVATSGSALAFDGTYFTANGLRLAGTDVTNTIYQATGALGISTGSASGITFYTNLANRYQIDATGVAVWSVGGSESMRLTSTGLGIGTASPVGKLQVTGSLASFILNTSGTEFYNNYAGQVKIYASNAAGFLSFGSGGRDNDVVLSTTGNLGIGTASPTVRLHIEGSANTTSRAIFAKTSAGTLELGADRDVSACPYIGSQSNSAFAFITNNTERARIDASGNLGLGVTPRAWAGGYKSLDILGPGAIASTTSGDTFTQVANGAWFNGTNWIYQYTGIGAARYQMTGPSGGGNHSWYVANSGTAGNTVSFTQAMTLNASGNLGIGTTSPATKFVVSDGGGIGFEFAPASGLVQSYNRSTSAYSTFICDGSLFIWRPSGTEAMRLTAAGELLVGTTSNSPGAKFGVLSANSGNGIFVTNTSGTSSYNAAAFYNNGTTFSNTGAIVVSGSTTAYNTSSDRRLKDNIAPADNAGSVIDAIEVVKHDWKVGGHTRYGMIAQDLHMVAPEAVSVGDADDVEDFKNPWGVDYSKLVPMLVKEVQSLRKRVAELEAK